MRHWQIPLSLYKIADKGYRVGGVASGFLRDLDGEAITPEAVKEAIPDFMASRDPDGTAGGPIRLHHNFWNHFLKQAIASLNLAPQEQMDLVAAIALPLGRVTKMWVDKEGVTHWEGQLSEANPIARIVWRMLQEKVVPLGVSLGGKIFATCQGRDRDGKPCTLITKIRIDELSITDNPAYRLCAGEGTGAYIRALTKAIAPLFTRDRPSFVRPTMNTEKFLRKTLAPVTGLGDDTLNPPMRRPKARTKIEVDTRQPATGLGRAPSSTKPLRPRKSDPPSDVWGLSVGQLAAALKKCACMDKAELGAPATLDFLTQAAAALSQCTESPPPPLVNLVRFLQYFSRFAAELPHMSDFQAKGTVEAMTSDLKKALEDFEERLPTDLLERPLRPPGSPPIQPLEIVFPAQYQIY